MLSLELLLLQLKAVTLLLAGSLHCFVQLQLVLVPHVIHLQSEPVSARRSLVGLLNEALHMGLSLDKVYRVQGFSFRLSHSHKGALYRASWV